MYNLWLSMPCTIRGNPWVNLLFFFLVYFVVGCVQSVTDDDMYNQWQSFGILLLLFFSRLLCFISISVGIEILPILGSTSPVKERLHCPGRDGGEASKLVTKATREHR